MPALTRGCCRQVDPDDPLSRFEIHAKTFKVTGPDGMPGRRFRSARTHGLS